MTKNDDFWISPQHRASFLAGSPEIERKIEVFNAQVTGWTFDHARSLVDAAYLGRERAGFAILMLCSAYFETLEGCWQGRPSRKGEAKKYFVEGFRRVFSDRLKGISEEHLETLCSTLYGEVRCGLYHRMSTDGHIVILHSEKPIDLKFDADELTLIEISPRSFFKHISDHFEAFVMKLRDPAEIDLRGKFEQYFDGRGGGRKQPTQLNFPAGARSTYR